MNQQNLEPLKEAVANVAEVVKKHGAKRIEELEKIERSFKKAIDNEEN